MPGTAHLLHRAACDREASCWTPTCAAAAQEGGRAGPTRPRMLTGGVVATRAPAGSTLARPGALRSAAARPGCSARRVGKLGSSWQTAAFGLRIQTLPNAGLACARTTTREQPRQLGERARSGSRPKSVSLRAGGVACLLQQPEARAAPGLCQPCASCLPGARALAGHGQSFQPAGAVHSLLQC